MISLIVRKSYGGGSVLSFPADLRLAYPFARVQPMGTEAAKAVAAHRTFGEPADPAKTEDADELVRQRLGDRYDSLDAAVESGIIDEVIHPRDTRRRLVSALAMLERMPRRELPNRFHSNIPL
jgi:propionyl-CoA carboxylase beta chain